VVKSSPLDNKKNHLTCTVHKTTGTNQQFSSLIFDSCYVKETYK